MDGLLIHVLVKVTQLGIRKHELMKSKMLYIRVLWLDVVNITLWITERLTLAAVKRAVGVVAAKQWNTSISWTRYFNEWTEIWRMTSQVFHLFMGRGNREKKTITGIKNQKVQRKVKRAKQMCFNRCCCTYEDELLWMMDVWFTCRLLVC